MAENEHLEKLEKGLNLLIEIRSGLFRGNYLSSIFKIDKGKELYIEAPEDKDGNEVKLWPKTLIYLSFFRDNEPGAIYIFSGVIEQINTENIKKCIVVKFPKEIERIQRRNYVRVDLRLPFKYEKISKEDNESIIPVMKKGYIMDLSGGGVFLRTIEPLEKDQLIQAKFYLGNELYDLKCKIVRVIPKQRGKAFMYKYGVIFEDIQPMVRRKIIGYVFDVERQNIRKQKEQFI